MRNLIRSRSLPYSKLWWASFVFACICFPTWGELVVQGTFEDVVLRRPIKQFTVTPGQPKVTFTVNQLPEIAEVHWHDNLTKTFRDGQFSWHFIKSLEQGFGTPGDFILRLDAQGYQSVTTPVIKLDAGIAKLGITARRISEIHFTVKQIGGQSIDPSSLRILQRGSAQLIHRRSSKGFNERPSWETVTDGVRSVQKIDPYAPMHLFVLTDQGFGEVHFEQTPPNVLIQLEPWAFIEGTLTKGGEPIPNVSLSLHRPGGVHVTEKGHSLWPFLMGPSRNGLFEILQTDEQGRFIFDQVPSGEIIIARQHAQHMRSPFPGIRFPVSQYEGLKSIYIEPASHHKLNIQLSEIVVKGNLQWPLPDDGMLIECHVEPSDLKVSDPKEGSVEERQQWIHAWYWSEEMDHKRHWFGGMPHLLPSGGIVRGVPVPSNVSVDHEGQFEIPDLTPGAYVITFLCYEDNSHSYRTASHLKGGWQYAFTIPENLLKGKYIDLGEIKVPRSAWNKNFVYEWRMKQMRARFGR